MKWTAIILLIPLLAACGEFPRDQRGTLERIRSYGVVRIGVIASAAPSPDADRLRDLVVRSAQAAGGRPRISREAAEPLLLMLEQGEIDLVVGEFDRSTPWSRRVHLLPPLATETRGESQVETTAAARNGENGWIMLLEREAKALAADR